MKEFNWGAFVVTLMVGYLVFSKLIPFAEKQIRLATIRSEVASRCERHVGKWAE